jgi:hypothetical protein
MRTTHTGLRAGRDRLERLYLNCHYEDSLIEKAG